MLHQPQATRVGTRVSASSAVGGTPRGTVWEVLMDEPVLSELDMIICTSVQRWKMSGTFPSRAVFHLLLILLVSLQAVLLTSQFVQYQRDNLSTFRAHFLPEKYHDDGIYSASETVQYVMDIVKTYYSFTNVSVARFDHLRRDDGSVTPPLLRITRYANLNGAYWNHRIPTQELFDDEGDTIDDEDIRGDFSRITETFPATIENPIGPLQLSLADYTLQNYMYSVTRLEVMFSLRSVNVGRVALAPYFWDITVSISKPANAGRCLVDIDASVRVINMPGISGGDVFNLVCIVLCLVSLVPMLQSVRVHSIQYSIYQKLKHKFMRYSKFSERSDAYRSWADVPLHSKLSFINLWELFDTVGSTVILFSTIFGMAQQFGFPTSSLFMISTGTGVLFAFTNIWRYLEYYRELHLHMQTLRHAAKHILFFMMSVIPVYWAYAVFGVLNFGPYTVKFGKIEEGTYGYPVVYRVYIFTFVTLFITTVLNVFIFIIEDAYHRAKEVVRQETYHDGPNGHHMHGSNQEICRLFQLADEWEERSRRPGGHQDPAVVHFQESGLRRRHASGDERTMTLVSSDHSSPLELDAIQTEGVVLGHDAGEGIRMLDGRHAACTDPSPTPTPSAVQQETLDRLERLEAAIIQHGATHGELLRLVQLLASERGVSTE